MNKHILWLIYLLEVVVFFIYTPLLILTTFVSITCFTIGIPVLFLIFIRGFFPNGEILNLFGFPFNWFDLIIYVPGGWIAFSLMKNAVIPITWFVSKTYVKFPER